MSFKEWAVHFRQQVTDVNPFKGDCLPSRVSLLGRDRPSFPFPHPWNYKKPIKIFEAFYWESYRERGSGRHNRFIYLGGLPPILLTREPAVIKAVLAATGDHPGQFDRDTSPTAGIGRATGVDSLLYSNGAIWRRQKTLSTAPFSRSNLFQPEKFHGFEQTFRKTVAQRLDALRSLMQTKGQNTVRIELEEEIKVIMLEMLVNNFFGAEVSYQELRDRYVPSLVMMIDHMVTDTVDPVFQSFLGKFNGRNEILKKASADFEELTDIALSGRKEGLGLWGQFKSDAPDNALRSNIRVFLAGAMEATTSFASWAISHLSHAPEIQEKIYNEVKDMNVYDPDNLASAVTLNRVLEETLRLTPALYFLPRRATADTWIETADHRKMFIPKGTQLRLDVWHANRCEEFWGTKVSGYPAESFAPERWDVLADKGLTAKDMLHFGFGHGPRFCPGRYLGLLEVGLVVGAMVKMFKFTAVRKKTEPRAGVSTKPSDGVLVNLELRDPFQTPSQAQPQTRLQTQPKPPPEVQPQTSVCPVSQPGVSSDMKQKSTGRRLVEALYDVESGKTFVRHPEKEEWVEPELLADVLKGHPVSSVSSHDECEVYAVMPHGRKKAEPKKSTLSMTYRGHFNELDRR